MVDNSRQTGPGMQEECELMPTWALRAGARRKIYFEPSAVTAAIVTCGGLCPGLNDVIQGLVQKLTDYGVPDGGILGIRCASYRFSIDLDSAHDAAPHSGLRSRYYNRYHIVHTKQQRRCFPQAAMPERFVMSACAWEQFQTHVLHDDRDNDSP